MTHEESQPKSLKLLQICWSPRMDSGLRCAPQIIFLDSSLGFVQASQGLSLCSFGGSSTPEIWYALSRYHAGRQNVDPNRLLL